MIWLIFFLLSLLICIVLVPPDRLRKLWPAGFIAMVLIFIIDNVLVSLGAFSYSGSRIFLSGIPFFYWISSYSGGILLVRFLPTEKRWQLPYIFLAAACLVLLELLMVKLLCFRYHRWDPVKSFILDIFGFMLTLWLAQWFGVTGAGNQSEVRYNRE